MGGVGARPASLALGSRCFRITDRGRAYVKSFELEQQTMSALSRHLHDLLLMCSQEIWFGQLRQFMPPKSLEDALRSLLEQGLIETVENALPARVRGRAPALPRMEKPLAWR